MKNNVKHQLSKFAKIVFKPFKAGTVEAYINGEKVGVIAEAHKAIFFNRIKSQLLNGTEVDRIARQMKNMEGEHGEE